MKDTASPDDKMAVDEPSDNHDVIQMLDTIETLDLLLDDDVTDSQVRDQLRKLQERIATLLPPPRDVPHIEEVVDPDELAFKCVCTECQGHVPIFQHDLKLSLDFHRQTEQHKVAVKKKELKETEDAAQVEAEAKADKDAQNNSAQANAKNLVFGETMWIKNKDLDVKRNDLNAATATATDTNKKQAFWNSIAEGNSKMAKSFDGLPVQRHHIKTFGQSKAPKKKRLYVQGHPNHPKSLEKVADTHNTATPPSPSQQHSVNIHLHIDTAAAAANSSQPNFPIHGTDVADATQEQYVQRRLVDTEVLDKLRNRTLEYREELELMWGCVKHAEGDNWNNEHITKEGNVFHCHVCNEQLVSPYDVVLHVTLEYREELELMWGCVKHAEGDNWNNEHITKEGNVFHCHVCNEQLVSPYDVVLHVYGDDHLRDLGAYYCVIQ